MRHGNSTKPEKTDSMVTRPCYTGGNGGTQDIQRWPRPVSPGEADLGVGKSALNVDLKDE